MGNGEYFVIKLGLLFILTYEEKLEGRPTTPLDHRRRVSAPGKSAPVRGLLAPRKPASCPKPDDQSPRVCAQSDQWNNAQELNKYTELHLGSPVRQQTANADDEPEWYLSKNE